MSEGPPLLAVVPRPASDAHPVRATPGVEDDGGVGGVPAVAVDRHDLTRMRGHPPPQPVPDAWDPGRGGRLRRVVTAGAAPHATPFTPDAACHVATGRGTTGRAAAGGQCREQGQE